LAECRGAGIDFVVTLTLRGTAMAIEFDKFLQIRAPGRLLEQLDTAAALRMIDRSDYVRLALNDRLRADGIGLNCWDVATWDGAPLVEGEG
jgi:hypothetical protein